MLTRALQRQQTQLEIAESERKQRREQEEQAIVANAFNSKLNEDKQLGEDARQKALVDQTKEAGLALLKSGFLTSGNKMLEEAGNLEKNYTSSAEHNAKLMAAKDKLRGNIAFSINDPETLKQGMTQLSKLQIVVPPQYRVWNDQTKEYFQKMGQFSESRADKVNIEAKISKASAEKVEADAKLLAAKNKQALTDRRIALRQAAINQKMPSDTQLFDINRDLITLKPYEDLDKNDKGAASNDYFRLLADASTQTDSAEEAAAMAKDTIAKRIRGNKYIPLSAGALMDKPVLGRDEWLAKAKSISGNSEYTDAELLAHYDKTYGKK